MPYLLWDASALAKRYTKATGSGFVMALFEGVENTRIITTIWGYASPFPFCCAVTMTALSGVNLLWRRFSPCVPRLSNPLLPLC